MTDSAFAVEAVDDGHWLVRGELDFDTAPQLLAAVNVDGRVGDVVLSCAELTFVDSQGIRAFVVLAKALPGGATLVLEAVPRRVRRVLELVQLDQAPGIRIEP